MRLGPKDVLRWLLVLMLGAMAFGTAAILVVVGAGKLGVELIPTFEMRLFVATASWLSLPLWAATAGGFGAAAVLLAKGSKRAFWGWLVGFVAAAVTQAMETTAASNAGAAVDPSGAMVLFVLALMGWGVFVLTLRRPPGLPRH